MAFNGSGSFTRLYNWVSDRNASIKIRADRMDAEMDGIATGLSTCITKDGQTTITQDIPFNNKKITGLADAAAGQDAVNRQTGDARYAYKQLVTATNAAYGSTGTALVLDDTMPLVAETTSVGSAAIAPVSATSTLLITVTVPIYMATLGTSALGIYKDSDTTPLRLVAKTCSAGFYGELVLTHTMTSGGTSAITFTARVGGTQIVYVNGNNTTRIFGGASAVVITIREV